MQTTCELERNFHRTLDLQGNCNANQTAFVWIEGLVGDNPVEVRVLSAALCFLRVFLHLINSQKPSGHSQVTQQVTSWLYIGLASLA